MVRWIGKGRGARLRPDIHRLSGRVLRFPAIYGSIRRLLKLPASLVVYPTVMLRDEQRDALEMAARTLPDGWTVIVSPDGLSATSFTVRIVGLGFATLAGFTSQTVPERLAAFIEGARRSVT